MFMTQKRKCSEDHSLTAQTSMPFCLTNEKHATLYYNVSAHVIDVVNSRIARAHNSDEESVVSSDKAERFILLKDRLASSFSP